MEDIFTIYFQNHDSISATSWCDGEWSQITITNGSRLLNPLQCGIYSPYNLFFRGIDVRADREKRTGKMLERIVNAGGLVVTVEPNEVERMVNASKETHNRGVPQAHGTGFSTTTYILIGLGGLIGVVTMTVGLGAAIWERVKAGIKLGAGRRVPQLEMIEEASAPVEVSDKRKGPLEIEIHGSAYAVEHYGDMEVKRQVNLVLPKYSEGELH